MPYTSSKIISVASPFPDEILAFAIYAIAALLLITLLLIATWWLGAKTNSENKEMAYESGVIPTGNARLAYPVPFYLIAIFFIVFDVEAMFIFTWAVAWDLLDITGLVHITLFIGVLLVGLIWLWIKGGLDWGSPHERNVPYKQSPR